MPIRIRAVLIFALFLIIIVLARLGYLADNGGWSWLGVTAIFAGATVLSFVAHFYIPRFDLTMRSRFKLPVGCKKCLALTFDGGPTQENTPRILDLLKSENVKATFFLSGAQVQAQPGLAQRIAADGHEIGNHGYSHRRLLGQPQQILEEEIEQGGKAIEKATGKKPAWFRSPGGYKSVRLPVLVEKHGLRMIAWSVSIWDTDKPGIEKLLQRLLKRVEPRDVLLLHDGCGHKTDRDATQMIQALRAAFPVWHDRGYKFVTLSEAFAGATHEWRIFPPAKRLKNEKVLEA